jgi:hypothetical protein
MLFHLTISHGPQDCPGRRPSEPPALIAPSDTRRNLEQELGITLHYVLWGASCMLWAQPEHLAFAVLEADDLESVSQYVDGLVPSGWSWTALPVWNLPAQLRLVRQVRMAPPMDFGQKLPSASAIEGSESKRAGAGRPPAATTDASIAGGEAAVPAAAAEVRMPAAAAEAAAPVEEPAGFDLDESPGTITRLLRDLEAAPVSPGERKVITKADQDATDPSPTPTQILSQLAHEAPPTARVWLVSIAGPAKGKTFVVGAQGATIGRVSDVQVHVPDERLSREHARIEFRDGAYWLTDLGSMNGTALNGTLLKEPHRLQSGDSIELGASLLVVTIEPTPGA